jgi:pimeloyl-ACP methyl ester carboxylesterase
MLFRIICDCARNPAFSRCRKETGDIDQCGLEPAMASGQGAKERRKGAMSTIHFVLRTFLAVGTLSLSTAALAEQGPIRPFKDELFSKQTVLESAHSGAYEVIDYQEMRDINGRDQVPERRVKNSYVSLGVRREQKNLRLMDGTTHAQDVAMVGDPGKADFAVIFIHGRGGDRRLGVNDYTFGGNFNRLKNLVVGNGGVYVSPSVADFGDKGVADISALIGYLSHRSTGGRRPVILACASMGGFICSGVAKDAQAAALLKGMVLLGGPPDAPIAASALAKLEKPLYFAHGSADSVYSAKEQQAIFEKLHARGYPARFTLFSSGSHGTPIRMTDWRKVLNFVLTAE